MSRLFEQYLVKSEFSSMEDFQEHFQLVVPENFNFGYDVVDALAAQKPDKLAMIWTNVAGAERRFTFADIKRESDRAAAFFAQQGVGKGDSVMLILKRHAEFWFSIVALHKLGAVAIPATHLLTTKDVVYRANAADIKMVVCTADGEVADHVDAALPECPTLTRRVLVGGERPGWLSYQQSVQAAPPFERPTGAAATRNEDPSLLYFTSGTTGYPKMVRHNFLYPLGHIITAAYWHNAKADGLHFTVSDTGWGKAVWGKLYGQWLAETCVFVYDFDKFDPPAMLAMMEKYQVTAFCAPPTIYRFLMQAGLEHYDLSSLKWAAIAGEPLNPEIYNRFYEATGLKMREAFGQTETTVALGTFPWMEPRPGSMGKPSPLFQVDLVDEEGNTVPDGEVGEIAIHTGDAQPVGMFMGYHKDPELTRKAWHDGLYRTGDTAWRDEDGYYWYVGRADDVIKSSGYRIGPFEVESALMEHPAVLETAITGVPDPLRGQVVKATVVLKPGYTGSDALKKQLQDHVKRVTAPYKYPRIVEFVDELPKTISGKIRRVELRQKDQRV